jgi:uncharacterized protein with NAD-binding domain and iron-sulfur cluster
LQVAIQQDYIDSMEGATLSGILAARAILENVEIAASELLVV